jgi:hypothetical protein
MKKIICLVSSIILATTLMVGCKGTTEASQSEQTTTTTESTQNTLTSDKGGNFEKADLEGEVASIDGNKITLKVIKTPEPPTGKPEEDNQNNASKDADKKEVQVNNQDGETPKAPQHRQVEYTGETKEITIADGIKIITMNKGPQDSESKELTVNDIKVGDTLQITYSDSEKETISQINVRSAVNTNKDTNNE